MVSALLYESCPFVDAKDVITYRTVRKMKRKIPFTVKALGVIILVEQYASKKAVMYYSLDS